MKVCRQEGCEAEVENPDKLADCRECTNRIRREAYRTNPEHRERILSKNRKFFKTVPGKIRRMLVDSRGRAKRKGYPHTITEKDIVIPEFCPYLGIPLCLSNDKKWDNSPSLDKKVPSLGYVPGNVEVISEKANRIKTNASADEVSKVAKRMRNLNL